MQQTAAAVTALLLLDVQQGRRRLLQLGRSAAEGTAVADIDPLLLSAELGIMSLLAVQVVLAVIALLTGCAGRRRWDWVVLLAALVLAAAACGGTLYRCAEARESVRGRVEGRVPGPHLPVERAENHIAGVAGYGWLSIGIEAATWLVGGILYFSLRRARSAESVAVPDRGGT